MNIVVLDGYTLNPGDLSWAPLHSLGNCQIHDRTPVANVVARAAHAEILLTNKTPVSADTIEVLPELRYIGVLATGYDVVDIAAARVRRIPVCNVPAYSTMSVAQVAIAHLMNLTLRVADHSSSARSGTWSKCADFCYWEYPLIELAGMTLGIVGYGRIGQATASIGRALGMHVIAHDPRATAGPPEVELIRLDDLFARSDVVSLHCPLTPSTAGLVNRQRLALMKRTAFIINTSRGGLVDEAALAEALATGAIAGAGVDVLSSEPPPADHPLLRAPNCFLTPHVAWATKAARERLLLSVVDNIKAFLSGSPHNVVNP